MARLANFIGVTVTLAGLAYLARAQTACGGTLDGKSVISTPNYPKPPPSGQICRWTLQPATGQIASIYFSDFDVGPDSYLDIYNGTTTETAASLLTSYTNRGPGGGIITVAGPVTLQFRGAALQLNRGFSISFSSIFPPRRSSTQAPFTGCGEQLINAGTVTSPGFPGWYPVNSKCIWTLTPCEAGAQITIQFSAFDVENVFDKVEVYIGQAPNWAIYATYTGSVLPQPITINSPVTVVFTSDNINAGNSGFSLQFSTVSSAVAPVDPLVSPQACPALCPAVVEPDPTSYCYAHDDPHVKPFCATSTFEFQYEGVYYMYKHKTAPISVQAAFQSCDSPAPGSITCVCAVAVRYCNEVFVIDRCLHVGSSVRANNVYKAGTGSQMSIAAIGLGFKVSLPTGLTVDIGSSWKWIGTVDIRDSLANKNMADGLCDCYQAYRCGTSASQYPIPGKSWSVPPEESLFTYWKPAIPCDIATCTACTNLPSYPNLPPNVADAGILFTPDQYCDGSTFLFQNSPSPPTPRFVPPWTQSAAEKHCTGQIAAHPAIALCQRTLGGRLRLTGSVNDCVRDILLTGGSTFTQTALEGSKLNCLRSLSDAGLSDAAVLSLICPNECSSRGTCKRGTCVCNAGWFGPDCSIDPSTPPILTGSSTPQSCPATAVASGSCLLQAVYGQTFYNVTPGYPACKIQSEAESATTAFLTAVTTTVSARYVSAGVVVCQLPAGRPGETVGYVISVSNDGVTYSNQAATSRYFRPRKWIVGREDFVFAISDS